MKKSSSKLLRSLCRARACLAPALAILLLGAAAPRLAAQTISDDFNSDSGIEGGLGAWGTNAPTGWEAYLLPNSVPADPPYYCSEFYGQGRYMFTTNPASAGNYAFRIQSPGITNNPYGDILYNFGQAGAWQTDATYTGRFLAQMDLVRWDNTISDQVIGLSFYTDFSDPTLPNTYLIGWGPGLATLGIAMLGAAVDGYGVIGNVAEYSTALNTNHQYRFEASSHDGATFLGRIFDLAQPNSPWQSCITYDTSFQGVGGYCGMFAANTADMPQPAVATDATYDNFYATLPADGTMPCVVTDLYPPPAGNGTFPQVSVGIFNRDTLVDPVTIMLYMDGVLISPSNPNLNIDPNYVYKPIITSSPLGRQVIPIRPISMGRRLPTG